MSRPYLNLTRLPWFLETHIALTLANEKCSPDAVLLIADALEEAIPRIPDNSHYKVHFPPVIDQLRNLAAYVSAPGKPHGDFDWTLTP